MTGDQIIHDYKGAVYSERTNTYIQTKRFSDSSLRMHALVIKNNGATYPALIGMYHSSEATFTSTAYTLDPDGTLHFDKIDLYYLGYLYSGNYTALEIIGTY